MATNDRYDENVKRTSEGYLGPYYDPTDPSMVQVGEEQTMSELTFSLVRSRPAVR